MRKVVGGQRPEWPSNNLPQGFTEVLWKRIKTCWKQEPEQRPTASNVLEAFGGTRKREPATSVGDQDDDAAIGKWEYAGVSLNSGRDGRKNSGWRHRFGKHICDFLHLPRRPTMKPVGRHEPLKRPRPVARPKPGAELIDQREEVISVRDDRVPYLVSRPIPEGGTLKKVVITAISKDQGWSSYQADHGTYRNSWTWFELSVGPSKDSEKWCGEVVRNLHAHEEFKEHTVEIEDGELYEKTKSGDVLTVWALARYPGWRNTVKKITIRYMVE